MIALRCEAGGTCAARARWVLVDAASGDSAASCQAHLEDARRRLGVNALLIRRVGLRAIEWCEWVAPLNRRPWVRRCPRVGEYVERYDDARIRLCAEHLAAAHAARAEAS